MFRHSFPVRSAGKLLFPHLPAAVRAKAFPNRYRTLAQPAWCKQPGSGQEIQCVAQTPSLPASKLAWERLMALHWQACTAALLRELTSNAHAMKLFCYLMERGINALSPLQAAASCLRLCACPDPREGGCVLAGGEMLRRYPKI